jgi:hypothetical protein
MDPAVKQMIDGMRMGIDAQAGNVNDPELLERAYGIIDKMEALAAEGGDAAEFQQKSQELMTKYGQVMSELATAQTAGLEQQIENAEKMAEELEPVDLETLDITDLSIVVKPHRMIYDSQVKNNPNVPHQQAAYEALFALAEECATIPEFNRRSLAEGHQHHLGLSSTWDANLQSLKHEIKYQQPEMITWALNALEKTRDYPSPENISYALTELALVNEQRMARRRNAILPFTCFTDALGEYLLWPHMHTEEQRRKIHRLLEFSRELTDWEMDEAFYRPYVRRRTETGQDKIAEEQGPDYLGLTQLLRAGWHLDAKYSPEERKAFKGLDDVPAPDPLPHPYRTGPVGGVELVLSQPAFALPFDEAYTVRLTITNHAAEPRTLDVAKGLRCWLFDDSGAVAVNRLPVEPPAELAPGASQVVEGDLYAWGLTRVEGLRLVAFDVGIHGGHGCDLAEKYSDPGQLSPFTMANYVLQPFDGGAATAPAFVMPHRPVPEYPFPIPLTGL